MFLKNFKATHFSAMVDRSVAEGGLCLVHGVHVRGLQLRGVQDLAALRQRPARRGTPTRFAQELSPH